MNRKKVKTRVPESDTDQTACQAGTDQAEVVAVAAKAAVDAVAAVEAKQCEFGSKVVLTEFSVFPSAQNNQIVTKHCSCRDVLLGRWKAGCRGGCSQSVCFVQISSKSSTVFEF